MNKEDIFPNVKISRVPYTNAPDSEFYYSLFTIVRRLAPDDNYYLIPLRCDLNGIGDNIERAINRFMREITFYHLEDFNKLYGSVFDEDQTPEPERLRKLLNL